jgi:hypothetical protein
MRIYTGKREKRTAEGGATVFVDGHPLALEPSLEIRQHSPTGFEWGYGGSGPSQLALAILLDLYDRHTAEEHYQEFKWKFISTAPQEGFAITSTEIDAWLKEQKRLRGE